MRNDDGRGHVLAGALLGDDVIMAEPEADLTGVPGTPPSPVGEAADFTSPNGNGHSEVDADSGDVIISLTDPTAVATHPGDPP